MKKKFASYLLMGKAATVPFLSSNVLADVKLTDLLFSSNQQHLIERPTQGNILMNYAEGGVSMQRVFPGHNCTFDEPSPDTSFVVTGLRQGDYVYLLKADDTGTSFTGIHPKLTIGENNLRIISQFSVDGEEGAPLNQFENGGGDFKNSVSSIAVPIDFFEISPTDSSFFAQALISRNGAFLVTEIDEIESVTATCDIYGDIQGGGSYGGSNY